VVCESKEYPQGEFKDDGILMYNGYILSTTIRDYVHAHYEGTSYGSYATHPS
jgi:hypothetical protein